MVLVVDRVPEGIKIWKFKLDGSSESFYLAGEFSGAVNLKRAVSGLVGRGRINCISFRMIFGGDLFAGPVPVDTEFFRRMEQLTGFFTLHLPSTMSMIEKFHEAFEGTPMMVFFENTFFRNLPDEEKYYALPVEYSENSGIRKWGFHGIFHENSAKTVSCGERTVSIVFDKLTTVCAIRGREPVSISLGYTPLEGVMSRTSSGDIDPGIVLYLMTVHKYSLHRIDDMLKEESGFLGLTGYDISIEDMIKFSGKDKKVDLAFQVYKSQILKYVAEGLSLLGGLDNIVFSGSGTGVLNPLIHGILKNMSFLGVNLKSLPWESEGEVVLASSPESRVKVYINKARIPDIIFQMSKPFLLSKKPA
ncbi:MAG TPA: hypothetical protein PKZ41_00335 [Candidatus Omnitrophota bacterium]|nr:hypothetical protein [Candidatus Omnitrophota bacterium]